MTTPATPISNPILTGMYPDPSWIWDEPHGRIALVNSSFELVPGLPIHVSDDLGRWTHLTDAIDAGMARRLLIPFVEDSGGVYAPTLRRIAGRYAIACTIARIDRAAALAAGVDPAELEAAERADGNFVIVADALEGPWRGPYWIDGAEGIDPDLFEDSDGRVYWTQTRPAVDPRWEGQTEVWTRRIDPATWRLADDDGPCGRRTVIWRGYGVDAVWAEGPHLYRVGEYVYLMTAEGGTSFEHSEMAMRVHAPRGLAEAVAAFEREEGAGDSPVAVRDGERCLLGVRRRLLHADKKNPILTHRHLGLSEPVQCVGHADLIRHPRLGWWLVCLGVRETRGPRPGELLSYLGREPFIAPVTWERNPADWKLDGGGAPRADGADPGWPVVAPGLGRLPGWVALCEAGAVPPAGGIAVDDDRPVRVVMGLGGADGLERPTRPVVDVERGAREVIRAERGVRYARISADDCVIPVPGCGGLVIRQNSDHHVEVRVRDLPDADGTCRRAVACTVTDGGRRETRDHGPIGAEPGRAVRVAVLFRGNELTLFAHDAGLDPAAAAERVVAAADRMPHGEGMAGGGGRGTICGDGADGDAARDGVAGGACDGAASGGVTVPGGAVDGVAVLDRIDARFLSTEWAGGFVGCLAGVPTGRERAGHAG